MKQDGIRKMRQMPFKKHLNGNEIEKKWKENRNQKKKEKIIVKETYRELERGSVDEEGKNKKHNADRHT